MNMTQRKHLIPAPLIAGLALGIGLVLLLVVLGTLAGLTSGFYGFGISTR